MTAVTASAGLKVVIKSPRGAKMSTPEHTRNLPAALLFSAGGRDPTRHLTGPGILDYRRQVRQRTHGEGRHRPGDEVGLRAPSTTVAVKCSGCEIVSAQASATGSRR